MPERWQVELEAVDAWMRCAFSDWLCEADERPELRDFLVKRHPDHEEEINAAVMRLEKKVWRPSDA